MDWLPTISEGSGPIYRRIADALTNDITNGRLKRGQQLPTHRALAQALRLDLTTVTRAYGEARRRGLLDARVGQGTFVSETTTRATADLPHPVKIDLSMNVPPQPIEANLDIRIAQGLASIQEGGRLFRFPQLSEAGRQRRGSQHSRQLASSARSESASRSAHYLSGHPVRDFQCTAFSHLAGGRGANGGVDLSWRQGCRGKAGYSSRRRDNGRAGHSAGSAWQRVLAA